MSYRYKYLSTQNAETIKTGAGELEAIVVGATSAGAVKIYDSAGSGGVQIGELKASIAENTYKFDCRFAVGLHIENPLGSKLTVIYR
jgi:hypothetical protein